MSVYNGYKKCFIDVETTGTDRKLNHIFQISGAITDTKENILEEFDFRFQPVSVLNVEESALEKTGMTSEKLRNFPMTSGGAYNEFTKLLGRHCNKFDKKDKMQFVAYNAKFDDDFMREFFNHMGDNYYGSWFWSPPICVMQMAAFFLIDHRGALPNFQLGTLCKAAEIGWDETKAHDAQYDIHQTIALYKYLKEHLKSLGQ